MAGNTAVNSNAVSDGQFVVRVVGVVHVVIAVRVVVVVQIVLF